MAPGNELPPPGEEEDEEVWAKIKRNWVGYLSATSPTPEVALAPNRKANDHPVSLLERPGRDGGHDRAMAAGGAGRIEHEGTLEEMGLRLTESQIDDILDIEQEIWQIDMRAIARRREKGGFEDVW
ncbi:hypothetical protein FOXYSP1_10203, partial [Fusarium oxysporum f. sp. phaseoli]